MSLVRLYLYVPLINSHWKGNGMILIGLDQRNYSSPLPQVPPPSPIPLGVWIWEGHTPFRPWHPASHVWGLQTPKQNGIPVTKGRGRRSGEGQGHMLYPVKVSPCSVSTTSAFYRSLWSLGSSIPVSFIQNVHEFLCGFFVVFTWQFC